MFFTKLGLLALSVAGCLYAASSGALMATAALFLLCVFDCVDLLS